MAQFESFGNKSEKGRKKENYNSYLEKLWKEYRFFGQPPGSGSIAEKRLKNACDAYVIYLLETPTSQSGDARRRELHDEIARLTVGKSYEDLDYHTIEQLSDFSCRYSRGYSLAEAGEFVNQERQQN